MLHFVSVRSKRFENSFFIRRKQIGIELDVERGAAQEVCSDGRSSRNNGGSINGGSQ